MIFEIPGNAGLCPRCLGVYGEAHRCEVCGEFIDGYYIKTRLDDYICENCFETGNALEFE